MQRRAASLPLRQSLPPPPRPGLPWLQDCGEARRQAAALLGGSLDSVAAAVAACLHFYVTTGAGAGLGLHYGPHVVAVGVRVAADPELRSDVCPCSRAALSTSFPSCSFPLCFLFMPHRPLLLAGAMTKSNEASLRALLASLQQPLEGAGGVAGAGMEEEGEALSPVLD